MTGRDSRRGFASRPSDAESWIKASETLPAAPAKADVFAARLTIDVTTELRGRIKVAAFRRGVTVADMLRDLLAREFPDDPGETS
jgi:hypothetical protein